MKDTEKAFHTFVDFYQYYLDEHKHPMSRRLHFIGTSIVILLFVVSMTTQIYSLLLIIPLVGYGFAWSGHFFFEKNQPATFKYPLYSLMGDFLMFWQILTGKIQSDINS